MRFFLTRASARTGRLALQLEGRREEVVRRPRDLHWRLCPPEETWEPGGAGGEGGTPQLREALAALNWLSFKMKKKRKHPLVSQDSQNSQDSEDDDDDDDENEDQEQKQSTSIWILQLLRQTMAQVPHSVVLI